MRGPTSREQPASTMVEPKVDEGNRHDLAELTAS